MEIIQSILILGLVFAIPIFETLFVSILRIKGGKSPFKGSKDHFALRMVKSGLSIKKTVSSYLYSWNCSWININCIVKF